MNSETLTLMEIIIHAKKRPGMYGQSLAEFRAFLSGFKLGAAIGKRDDSFALCYYKDFSAFVARSLGAERSGDSWVDIIEQEYPDHSYSELVDRFADLAMEFEKLNMNRVGGT